MRDVRCRDRMEPSCREPGIQTHGGPDQEKPSGLAPRAALGVALVLARPADQILPTELPTESGEKLDWMPLNLLPTSLVGSYAQPDWLIDRKKLTGRFPPRVRAKELWRIAPEFLDQARDDATLLAIRDQERAIACTGTDRGHAQNAFRYAHNIHRRKPTSRRIGSSPSGESFRDKAT
jgi:hypothetical protein